MKDSTKAGVAPWIEIFARIGFVAKGLLYATIGTLAGCAGMGLGGATTDTRGAMQKLHDLPMGRPLLFALAAGLVGYALWRLVEGFFDADQKGNDAKGIAVRSSFVLRGIAHLVLAFSAVRVGMGNGSASSSSEASEQATAKALELPHGTALVWLIALGIAAFGAYQVYRAFAAKLNRNVNKAEVEEEVGEWVIVVSRIGIAARGIVFMAIGWLLVHAARERNARQAGGIDDALDALAKLGHWPFIAIAVGLIAYGIYNFLSARYRTIRAY